MYFPVSGVEISPVVPIVTAFVISFFMSMGGVSGAFLLLPFQVSVLGFTTPSVSSTNLVYNIIAIPGGVYRFIKDGRMAWPLAWIIIAGTLPGVLIGVIIRIKYLPDPKNFKIFIGCVLFYIAIKLLFDLLPKKKKGTGGLPAATPLHERNTFPVTGSSTGRIKTLSFGMTRCSYEFHGETFSFNTTFLFLLTIAVGLIGGIYGIGGGAIIAPFLIVIFRLPVYTTAGATLLGTLVTSIVGVIFYTIIAPMYEHSGFTIMPDWKLGVMFGIGGVIGVYLGARFQKYFPANVIKIILCVVLLFLSIRYLSFLF